MVKFDPVIVELWKFLQIEKLLIDLYWLVVTKLFKWSWLKFTRSDVTIFKFFPA